jgi:predicted Zn finger-like uncharacterized protein
MPDTVTSATRCPACGTTFRATRAQLAARQGKVRCGSCNHVFDGYAQIVVPPSAPQAPAASSPPAAPMMEYSASMTAIAVQSSPAELLTSGAPPVRAEALPPAASVPPPLPVRAEPVEERVFSASILEPAAPPSRPRRSSVWAFGCFLLVLALGAQAAYFFRNEVAAKYPPTRPLLEQLCDPLGCTVGLPQQPRSISIEASDMQVNDPSRPAFVTLTATLRNNAETAVGFPAIDVVLTNTRDHTLARRIFLPEEYLEAKGNARAGLPAKAEVTVSLTLDTQDLGAAGFRLDLLPAPIR